MQCCFMAGCLPSPCIESPPHTHARAFLAYRVTMQRPQHAAASCRDPPALCTWDDYDRNAPNPHVLLGAVVGGPDMNGVYVLGPLDATKL
jgi:hypothetical protein